MTLLKTALDASDYAEEDVEWPNVEAKHSNDRDKPTDSPKSWIRVQWQHGSARQTTIGSANGLRRYRNKGIVTISRFSPTGRGLNGVADFITFANDVLRGKSTSSGVVFRPMAPRDVQHSGLWYRSDAMIQFEYDEIK